MCVLSEGNSGSMELAKQNLPSGKLTYQSNIHIFNRKYIFNPGPFSIAMLEKPECKVLEIWQALFPTNFWLL